MFEWLFSVDAWLTLFTLSVLEIVLGIDNIILLAILVSKLPPHLRNKGRILGLAFAMLTRILLLLSLFWVIKLIDPLFSFYFGDVRTLGSVVANQALFANSFFAFFKGGIEGISYAGEISGRDLVLLIGGLFLIFKSSKELRNEISDKQEQNLLNASSNFWVVIIEIALIDIIFSLDTVITAIGIAKDIEIMIIAVVLAVLVMLFASKFIADFVDAYPSIKILALAFLVMIGGFLLLEGFDLHFNKAYIYVAMVFALFVQILNIIAEKRRENDKR